MGEFYNLTPREIVAELDKYIVGQDGAKKSVAIALRNRHRRNQLSDEMREEVTPKNILMMGPTGCGKTEIARRLAKIMEAPFVKVEATKFTEVGYVGRDVDSIVRDLVEASIRLTKQQKMEEKYKEADIITEEKIVAAIIPDKKAAKTITQVRCREVRAIIHSPSYRIFRVCPSISSHSRRRRCMKTVQKRTRRQMSWNWPESR